MTLQSNNKELHFIIGIGRSGTTILSKLLNSYQDVHSMPEAIFLIFFLKKFGKKRIFSQNDINDIFTQIDLYSHSHPWVGWKFHPLEVKNNILNIIKQNNQITYKQIISIIYQNFKVEGFEKSKAKIYIDKNPSSTLYLNQLSDFSPKSKFIWIIRDYRATILSSKQSVYIRPSNVAYNASRWKLFNNLAYNFYKKNKDKVLIVKYEDLVSNENEIERILLFLSIEPIKDSIITASEVELGNFNLKDQHKERFMKKYTDLNKTLNSDRLSSWKDQLTKDEIEISDAICGSSFPFLGYKTQSDITFIKKLIIFMSNLYPILCGYFDIFKDKLLYYFPIKLKIDRLRKRYIKLGFIDK